MKAVHIQLLDEIPTHIEIMKNNTKRVATITFLYDSILAIFPLYGINN